MTKFLLGSSAVIFGAVGVAFLFANAEIAASLGSPTPITATALQLAASGFLGLASIDWTMRSARMGGIYGRPLGMANALAFLSAAATLWRSHVPDVPGFWAIMATILAAGFGAVYVLLMFSQDT